MQVWFVVSDFSVKERTEGRYANRSLSSFCKLKLEKILDDIEHLVIELAWADDVSFEAIRKQTGRNEKQVIQLMRRSLKPSSFKLWRARVHGRKKKHEKRSSENMILKRQAACLN